MAYHLFFRQSAPCSTDRWQGPVLGFTVPREQWEAITITVPDWRPDLQAYLGKKLRWLATTAGRIGFGGCAVVETRLKYVHVFLPIQALNIRPAMLTLSFLLQDIEQWFDMSGLSHGHVRLAVGCSSEFQSISGSVSTEFKQALGRLQNGELEQVESDMRAAWRASAYRNQKRVEKDCKARIADGRFQLGCAGDACGVSMYPHSDPKFAEHNLGSAFQQATLLAGLASLYGRLGLAT